MEKNKKISVIIPVYNTENYLERCINSVINQTYKNLEIIIIDDGSTDNSGKICDGYAMKDNRIKVIHKGNEGVSIARNIGMSYSTGDYITFLDSDDYIDVNSYEECSKILDKEQIDVLKFGYIKEYGNFQKIREFQTQTEIVINKNEFDEKVFKNVFSSEDYTSIWNTVIKRELISDIEFEKNLKYAEDFLFTIKVLKKANNIFLVNTPFYHYVVNNAGATQKVNYNNTLFRIDNILYSYNKSLEIIMGESKSVIEQYSNKLSDLLYRKIGLVAVFSNYGDYKKLIDDISRLENYKKFIEMNTINYNLHKSYFNYLKMKVKIGLIENLKKFLIRRGK